MLSTNIELVNMETMLVIVRDLGDDVAVIMPNCRKKRKKPTAHTVRLVKK